LPGDGLDIDDESIAEIPVEGLVHISVMFTVGQSDEFAEGGALVVDKVGVAGQVLGLFATNEIVVFEFLDLAFQSGQLGLHRLKSLLGLGGIVVMTPRDGG